MSATTTDNPMTTSVLHVLQDYEVHHSGSDDQEVAPPTTNEIKRETNPSDWPANYNRIPAYRPLNRHLDMQERPAGLNVPEMIFIGTMLRGCLIIGVCMQYLPELQTLTGKRWQMIFGA